MQENFGYIEKEQRKNILLLCDDIRMHSGIATMAKEFVIGTAHHFNWFNVGAAINHPDAGKILDISEDVNKLAEIADADVKVMPYNGYGDTTLIRGLLGHFEFDAIFIFTDPRYWVWLFEIEREIRSKIPIFWLNIWDDLPAPMYNKNYYDSVDVLMAISKQTKNINEMVLGEKASTKHISYVPHGINEKMFYPILEGHSEYEALQEFKKATLPIEDPEFLVLFNSRNIQRKHPGDTILAYRLFCDMIGEEKAKKCAMIMHTQAVDQNGTDLRAVKEALTDPSYVNIFFSQDKISTQQLNMLYNMVDISLLITSNEGWGLSLTEAMMAGKMITANVTGGMQDQMRFVNEKGEWISFNPDFPSNHRGTYRECGEWAIPIFPSNISLAGSVPTPYIFDDRVDPEAAAMALVEAYNLGKEERTRRGLAGREWVLSEESQMSAKNMCSNIIKNMHIGFEKFTPRPKYEIFKAESRPSKKVTHKLTGY